MQVGDEGGRQSLPLPKGGSGGQPMPEAVLTLPTYTTGDALALLARLLESLGFSLTRDLLLREAAVRGHALQPHVETLSEVGSCKRSI